MKRIFALLLCGVMLLTAAVGCQKKGSSSSVIELNEARFIADLAANNAKYSYTHAEGKSTISDFTIVEKKEDGGVTTLAVTATATNSHLSIELEATMEYVRENNYWRLSKVDVTKAQPIPTSAPNRAGLLEALTNYVSITGSALAILGEEHYHLVFDVADAMWDLSFDEETKTAKLVGSLFSNELTFTGHYNLIFTENGWAFESEEQETGQSYPLLRLNSLEQKKDKK